MSRPPPSSILVIKLGALGDFFFALGAMKKIAIFHQNAEITLLTTAPYVKLAEQTGYFAHIIIDERPSLWAFSKLYQLRKWAKAQKFDRIYDLQNVTRTRTYMHALFSPSLWNGENRSAAFPYHPPQGPLHQIERKRQQLATAGLEKAPDPDLSFLKADLTEFDLPETFFLLVPGSSPQGTYKRWPATSYGEIAQKLAHHGVTPLIIGSPIDAPEAEQIQALCPTARNLCGKTTLNHLAALGRQARGVLGNDTGPFHILWLAGCPAIGIFSGRSDPLSCGPIGPNATVLQQPLIADISPAQVWETLQQKHCF